MILWDIVWYVKSKFAFQLLGVLKVKFDMQSESKKPLGGYVNSEHTELNFFIKL